MINAVLFDFGGVLSVGGQAGSVQKVLAEIYGIDEGDIRLDDLHAQLRIGALSTDDFFAELNRRHGADRQATLEKFIQSEQLFERDETVYAFAARLRKAGLRTGILSNVYAMSAELLRERGFYDGFDPVILSCEEHHAKPEPEIYQTALQALGLEPHKVLFIDDQPKCMPPAQALGFHTVLATSPEQIVRDATTILMHENPGLELLQ